MAERAYFGVSPSSLVVLSSGAARFRLAFRDVRGTLLGLRDPQFQWRVNQFVASLPGVVPWAYVWGAPMVDAAARVAVVDVGMDGVATSLTVVQAVDRVQSAFSDAEVIRVRSVPVNEGSAATAAGQSGELAAAVSADMQYDQAAGGPFDWLKGFGVWLVVVLALIAVAVFYARKKPGGVL